MAHNTGHREGVIMKSLVAYFSHEGGNSVDFEVKDVKKGHTRVVAEKLAEISGSTLFRIVPSVPYPDDYDEVCKRAKKEYEDGRDPEIILPVTDLDEYGIVFLGFPIWFRSYPGVISTFLNSFDFHGKKVYPFCTNEEGEFGTADLELKALVESRGGEASRGVAIKGSKVEECEPVLRKWLDTL